MAGRLSRGRIAGAGALLALALTPASAAAVDRYVDAETGADSNTACPQATPCDTLAYALANSGTGDEIRIDNGSYPETVTVGDGRSLTFENFVAGDGTAPAVIDGGTGTAVTVPASGAGTISDLVLRGDLAGVRLNGSAEVAGNTFDDPDGTNATGVSTGAFVDDVVIRDNTILDPAPSATRARVGIAAQNADVEIRNNLVTGMMVGISFSPNNDESLIEGNEVKFTHTLPVGGRSLSIEGGSVIVRENIVSDAASDFVTGISVGGAATLVRNEVSGHSTGVHVGQNVTGVTLDGDRLYDHTSGALHLSDLNATPPRSAVSMTNVSIANAAIFNDGGELTIDSSITGGVSATGSATCAITFSRGESAGTDPSGCDNFTTTADPQFVNAGAGNLHLSPGSPMLDAGNPAAPPLGAIDFDGDPRALDATPECSGNVDRRDIGADEFFTALPDCTPPETTIDSGPSEGQVINDRVPAIGFSSEAGATFQCSENGAAFSLCSHEFHHNAGPLADGPNSFAVRATDSAGNTDPSPDTVSFVVDTAEPDTTFTKKPPKKTTKRTVKFKFEADEAGTFTCQLDQKPAFACDSPEAVNVKVGRHKFRVTATDDATNVELEPAKYGFRRVGG